MPAETPHPSPPYAGFAALLLAVVAYAAIHAVGPVSGSAHYWMSPVLYAGCASLVVLRTARVAHDRTAWLLLAAGIALYGVGSLIYAAVGDRNVVHVPLVAHVAWVAFYLFAFAAVVNLLRARMRSLAVTLVLDGLIGALTLAALVAALLLGLATGVEGIGDEDAVFGLAYAASGILLLGLVLWAAWLSGRRGARMWLLLAAGVGCMLAGDIAVDLDALIGDFREGGVTRALYPLGTLVLAWAAWQSPAPSRRPRIDSLAVIAVPGVCVLAALGLQVYAEFAPLEPIARVLTILVLAVAFLRGGVTYRKLCLLKEGRRFQRGFEDATIGMALSSPDGLWIRANGALCTILGRRPEDLVGRPVAEVLHPDELPLIDSRRRELLSAQGDTSLECRLLHADGSVVEALIASVYVDEDGDDPYIYSQVQDVTVRNRALRHSETLASLGQLAIEEHDPHDLIDRALPLVASALGAGRCRLVRADDGLAGGAALYAPLRRGRDGADVLILLAERDGGPVAADAPDARFLQGAADVLAGALDRAHVEAETRRRALHDPLTGLANRTFLSAHVDQQLAAAERDGATFGLLLLDVDRFKMVNDTLGHTAGDELLVEVARRLGEVTRRSDVVARLGGDEFVVACRHTGDANEIRDLADRVVAAFDEPFVVAGRELILGASVGVAVAGPGERSAETLLRNADVAMYRAKEGGSRHVLFDDALRAGVVQRLTLELELRHALERGQLAVHYQPVVNLGDGSLHGFEALLRWEHPQHDSVSPADFIPIAEETGLILPIGAWVLDQACAQLAAWNARRPGRPLRVGVNLSAAQLTSDLVDEVRAAVARHQIAEQWLVLEITESMLVEGEAASDVLDGLRSIGVDIALDDFGTGYSSLGYISEYALDVVKLDRSLIARIGTSSRARGLMRGIVEMARALGLSVLAEGIEDEAQAEAARELGCALGQGWLYSKALDREAADVLADASLPAAA